MIDATQFEKAAAAFAVKREGCACMEKVMAFVEYYTHEEKTVYIFATIKVLLINPSFNSRDPYKRRRRGAFLSVKIIQDLSLSVSR